MGGMGLTLLAVQSSYPGYGFYSYNHPFVFIFGQQSVLGYVI